MAKGDTILNDTETMQIVHKLWDVVEILETIDMDEATSLRAWIRFILDRRDGLA